MKLSEQQLASLSSPKAVNDFLANQRENITNIIKQNLAVGDIFKRENLQVHISCILKPLLCCFYLCSRDNLCGSLRNRTGMQFS